ncbi:hypothetical protein LCM08_19470 [Salipiger pacificus]|nr:hypothetical protein [Alloyangia pacifica]MCA0947107.1 hypothetical protein [Alloyangia pacifica]
MHQLTTPIELRRPALLHYGTATLAKLAIWVAEKDLQAMTKEAQAIRRLLDWNPQDLTVGEIEEIHRRAC